MGSAVAIAAAVVCLVGVGVRLSIRDSIDATGVVYYATPWPVLAALVMLVAGGLRLRNHSRWTRPVATVGLISLASWLFLSYSTSSTPRLAPSALTCLSWNTDHGRAGWSRIAQTIMSSLGGVISTVALLVIVPVVAFYLLLDWDRMVSEIDRLLPREHAPVLRRLASEIDLALSGFVRGQGLVILILGTWYSIALMLVGLPFGFFIGIMAAALSFIPYVGVLIGGITAIGVALFSFWGDPLWVGAVIAIFALGQVVEGNYLQPKIVGGHVGLHPVWLLLALSVFGALFGFVGLVMAVPMAAALGVLARFLTERYRESALYTGQTVPAEPDTPTLVEIVPRGTVAKALVEARLQADRSLAAAQIETMQEDLRRDREA